MVLRIFHIGLEEAQLEIKTLVPIIGLQMQIQTLRFWQMLLSVLPK